MHFRIIASVSFRQLPWTSVGIRDVCGRMMDAAELLGGIGRNPHNRQQQGRNGEIIASVRRRQLPSSIVEICL